MKKKYLIKLIILLCCSAQIKAQNSWNLTGNSNTNSSINFIGTADPQDLVLKTNNYEALRIASIDQRANFNTTSNTAAMFTSSNYYGSFVAINSNSNNPSTGFGYRMYNNNTIKSQLFFNEGAFSFGTTLDGIVGNTDILSRNGDVYLSTTTFKSNGLMVKKGTGFIGIGINTPTAQLHTTGTVRFANLGNNVAEDQILTTDVYGNVKLKLFSGGITPDGSETKLLSGTNVTVTGSGTNSSPYVIALTNNASQWQSAGANNIVNTNSGATIIGASITNLPIGYKLYVSDGILTEKLKVALKNSSNWADYVFHNDYKLMPLNEVEKYINKNNHLPEIPSAETLTKEGGIDVNVMFAKQMQKIEELTLYIIEMNKKIEKIEKQNSELKASAIIIKK